MPTPEAIEPVGNDSSQRPPWSDAWNAYCRSLAGDAGTGSGGGNPAPPVQDGRAFLASMLDGDIAAAGALVLTRDDAMIVASLLATLTQLGKYLDAQA